MVILLTTSVDNQYFLNTPTICNIVVVLSETRSGRSLINKRNAHCPSVVPWWTPGHWAVTNSHLVSVLFFFLWKFFLKNADWDQKWAALRIMTPEPDWIVGFLWCKLKIVSTLFFSLSLLWNFSYFPFCGSICLVKSWPEENLWHWSKVSFSSLHSALPGLSCLWCPRSPEQKWGR